MKGQDLLDILTQPYDRIEKAGYGLLKENEKELLFIYDFFRNYLGAPDTDKNDPADEDSVIEISYQSHSQSVLFDVPLADMLFTTFLWTFILIFSNCNYPLCSTFRKL